MMENWNTVNNTTRLSEENHPEIKWVEENTAIIVIHGIGDQLPLETLDMFGRGLIKEYKTSFKHKIHLTHEIISKQSHNSVSWFDNAVRIKLAGSNKHIDVYEYYWANYTEDKATWNDLNNWLQGVVGGATKFYDKNKEMGITYSDDSVFINKRGEFIKWKYKLFIHFVSKTFIAVNFIFSGLLKFFTRIPIIGELASGMLRSFIEGRVHKFTNIIGDIVVYNVTDPKSKFYCVKRNILDGAVHALKFLLEMDDNAGSPAYPKVVVAGHSLGTQVAYDAINKIDLLVNKGELKNYTTDGLNKSTGKNIADQLNGFVTFGSPLDKIAFFLRDKVKDDNYLRQQLMDNYHGFKQRNWSLNSGHENGFTKLPQPIHRLFDNIQWRNYFDNKDYVSGSLDYYLNIQNVDCTFNAGPLGFTHSNYWEHDLFYKDIIVHFLK